MSTSPHPSDSAADAEPLVPTPDAAPTADNPPLIDVAAIAATLDSHFSRTPWSPPESLATGSSGVMEELAEDMLDLLRRVKAIEAAQTDLVARLGQFERSLHESLFLQAREVDSLRRELLGDQKAFVALSALNALLPAVDRFRLMRAAANSKKDKPVVEQLDATIEILGQTIRSLGYGPFEPTLGEPFDPQRMICSSHKPGDGGVVLGVDRPGYQTPQGVIVRPAGVILASPTGTGER